MPSPRQTGTQPARATAAQSRRANGLAAVTADDIRYRGEKLLHDFEENVARSPLTAAAIALAVGFVIGRMWR